MAKSKRKKRKAELRIIAVLVLCICSVVGYRRVQLEAEYNKKLEKKQELEFSILDEQERSKDLDQKKAYVQTKRFIEDVARQYLGLVYPDEVLLQPEKKTD